MYVELSEVIADDNYKKIDILTDLETHSFIELDWKCPGRKNIQQKIEEKVTPVFETPKER